jgi:hypothetical protein
VVPFLNQRHHSAGDAEVAFVVRLELRDIRALDEGALAAAWDAAPTGIRVTTVAARRTGA